MLRSLGRCVSQITTSIAVIAIVAALALFGVVAITVVTIPLQQAEAQVQGGCPNVVNPAGHNCTNPHEEEFFGAPPIPSCTSPNANKNSDVCRVTKDLEQT